MKRVRLIVVLVVVAVIVMVGMVHRLLRGSSEVYYTARMVAETGATISGAMNDVGQICYIEFINPDEGGVFLVDEKGEVEELDFVLSSIGGVCLNNDGWVVGTNIDDQEVY